MLPVTISWCLHGVPFVAYSISTPIASGSTWIGEVGVSGVAARSLDLVTGWIID